jgi:hypothetical protein
MQAPAQGEPCGLIGDIQSTNFHGHRRRSHNPTTGLETSRERIQSTEPRGNR